jgi:hypothetical protein
MSRKKFPVRKSPDKNVIYLSPTEFAKKHKVGVATSYRWCHENALQGLYKDGTGHWRIPSNAIRPSVPDWHFSNPKKGRNTKKKKAPSRALKPAKKVVKKKPAKRKAKKKVSSVEKTTTIAA